MTEQEKIALARQILADPGAKPSHRARARSYLDSIEQPPPITPGQLADWRELEDSATAAPWGDFAESGDYWIATVEATGEPGAMVAGANEMTVEDIRLIVSARNAFPRLLDVVEAQQAEIRRLQQQMAEVRAWAGAAVAREADAGWTCQRIVRALGDKVS